MGTPVKFGTEWIVNVFGGNDQSFPVISALARGGFAIVWQSDGQDGSGFGIFGRYFDKDGNGLLTEFQINTTSAGSQLYPSISGRSDGGITAAWQSADASGWGIFLDVVNAPEDGGGTVPNQTAVNVEDTDAQTNVQVQELDTSYVAVAWNSVGQDTDGSGVFMRIYDSGGGTHATEFQVNTTVAGDQSLSDVAALQSQKSVVLWTSNDADSNGVFASIVDGSGNVGPEIMINQTEAGNQMDGRALGLGDGSFMVVWRGKNAATTLESIYARHFDSTGLALGDEFVVAEATTGSQYAPHIEGLADGGYVVVWQEGGIRGQRFDSAGDKVGGPFQVNTTSGSMVTPSVAGLNNGAFVVTWQGPDQVSAGAGHTGEGIFAQMYKAQLYGTSASDTFSDDVGANWLDGRGGNDSIFGNSGADTILGGSGRDDIDGGNGSDSLKGGSGRDTLLGENGNDNLLGGTGNDVMRGGSGKDTLKGEQGNDRLEGQQGNDTLFGGGGADRFVFAPQEDKDTIRDFEDGRDRIDLSAFGFASKAQALAKFSELGTASDDQIKFVAKGTFITVKGIDMADLNGGDILI